MVPASVPSYWMVYFRVPDVHDAHRRALEAGATEGLAPQDFPGGRSRSCAIRRARRSRCTRSPLADRATPGRRGCLGDRAPIRGRSAGRAPRRGSAAVGGLASQPSARSAIATCKIPGIAT